jgi:uncharacterized membrane protein YheB (UPF0754 family)
MNMDVSTLDLIFRHGIIVVSILFGIADYAITPENLWIKGGFVVSMAGVVGYYTNFLAIKMLFQPKQGKVLGWEGLVPKNKKKIAESLGNSIQNQLLAPEIILAYIYERNLIEVGTKKLADWVDGMLRDENVRTLITSKIISLLREKGPELLKTIFDVSETNIKKITQNPKEINRYWNIAREKIIGYIATRENREKIALMIKHILQEEIPKLSKTLNGAIDQYLAKKNTLGGLGIGLKKLISFDDVAIQDLLKGFIENPETSEQFMGVMDILVDELQKQLESPETQEWIIAKAREWINFSSDYARQNLLPEGIEQLKEFLDDEKNWKALDNYFFHILEWIKNKVMELMNSEEGQEYLKQNIGKIVHQINVTQLVEEQVMKLDTDELEKMILDNTGGNLVVIQVLGGLLGIIAGFIQVNIVFIIPVGILVLLAWISYYINKLKYSDKQ